MTSNHMTRFLTFKPPFPFAPESLVAVAVIAGALPPLNAQAAPKSKGAASELHEIVSRFLLADDAKEAAHWQAEIEKQVQDDWALLETALQDVRPARPDVDRNGSIPLALHVGLPRSGDQLRVTYDLPDHYRANHAFPLLLVLTARPGDTPESPNQTAPEDSFIRVFVDVPPAGGWAEAPAWATLTHEILNQARARFAVDERRIYLAADRDRAGAGWIMLLSCADHFAGAILDNIPPDLPYPAHSYPLFIQNLRHTPVVVRLDTVDSEPRPEASTMASPNEVRLCALELLANHHEIPLRILRQPDFPANPRADAAIPEAWWTHHRPSVVPTVDHWFSTVEAGSAWWLRATKLKGNPPWPEQVFILPAAGGDRDAFISDFFQEHLTHLSGVLVENKLTINVNRGAEIEVRLTADMIEWSKPVVVIINGVKRFDRIVNPDVATLLREARAGRRLPPIRAVLSFSVQGNTLRHRRDADDDDIGK